VWIKSLKCSFGRWGLYDCTTENKNSQLYIVQTTKIKFWVFTFYNLSPEVNCGVALTEFFRARSWISVSSISAADKFVTNGWQSGQPSPTTLTLNGFTRNAKHCFNFCKWSNLAWNSSSSLAIYFCVLPPSWSAITSSRKGFALILTLGKWQKAFDNMLLRKILSSITLSLGSLFCYQIA